MACRTRVLAVVSLMMCLAPEPAFAQSTAAAEALFTEGRNAMDAKDYDTACQRFHESNRLDPAVGTLLNLAVCEATRNRLATAWELFRTVSEKLPAEDPRRDYVTSQLAQIEPRLPKLTMRLAPGAPADTKAMEGDVQFSGAAFGVPLPMDPGKHSFTVQAPGFEPLNVDVELAEGARQDLELAPGPARAAEPAAQTLPAWPAPAPVPAPAPLMAPLPTEEPQKGIDRGRIGWIVGGVGVVGVGVGIATGIVALGKKSVADDNCSDALRVCTQTGKDAASAGRTLAAVSTVSWVLGVAGLGAGAYLILTSNPKSGSATALGPDFFPGGAALHVTGRF